MYNIYDESLCMPRRKKEKNGGLESTRYRIPPRKNTKIYDSILRLDGHVRRIRFHHLPEDWRYRLDPRVAIASRERNTRWFTRPRKIEPRCNAPFRYLDTTSRISFRAAPLLEQLATLFPASCPRKNNCIIREEHGIFNRVPPFLWSIEHLRCHL